MKSLRMVCLLALESTCCVVAQGTFQNLGFESATLIAIPGDPYNRVQFATAFPGWTGYVADIQQNAALSNSYFLDSSGIGVVDGGWPHYFGPTAGLIEGDFTALLQAGVSGPFGTPADTTLSQTGLVPGTAESLLFRAYAYPFGSVRVFLAGQQLPLTALSSGPNYTVFGSDIRAWQGQTAKLDFTVIAQRPHVENINIFLDSVEFSNQRIPEPSAVGLLALGAILIGWRRRCKTTI